MNSREETNRFKNSLFAKILLLVLSLSFSLLSGELVVRYKRSAWPFQPPLKTYPYLTDKDKNLKWRFSPNDGRNSLGLRNREITPKVNGIFRILFLGDSLVWTAETSSGKLYTEVIEDNLNSMLNSSPGIEMINAGVPGYTTYQEIEFLKVYGLDMEPDIVLLGFVFNDLYYKYLHRPTKGKMLGRNPEARLHRFDTDRFPGSLFARSYLAHEIFYAKQLIEYKMGIRPFFPFERRVDFYLAWKPYGWRHSDELIGEMKLLLARRHIPLGIVIFPVSDQVDDTYLNMDRDYVLYPQKRIKEICKKYEIPYLDLTPAVYLKGGRSLFSDYLHLNKKGNDVVADEVTHWLQIFLETRISATKSSKNISSVSNG